MELYTWFKIGHFIFLVAWFAALFYIFRLFVYHVQNKENQEMGKVFQTMEKKLLYIIAHPAMLLTLIFGVGMLIMNPALLKQGWIHAKLLFVVLLIAYQIYAGIVHKKMRNGVYPLSEKACRMINEVPTVALIVIVIMAVLRPF